MVKVSYLGVSSPEREFGDLRDAYKRLRDLQGSCTPMGEDYMVPERGVGHARGTFVQRATGNMKVTQRLIGLIDPKSTHRYVHAVDDDVYAALQTVDDAAQLARKLRAS